MKLADCKVGMKVKVLWQGKKQLRDWEHFLSEYPNRIAEITRINASWCFPVQAGGFAWFDLNDLEPYIEPEETAYRQLKGITPRAIFQAYGDPTLCFMQELIRFVIIFDLEYKDVVDFENLIWELDNEPKWKEELTRLGFIEKVVEEVMYAVGNRFRLEEIGRDEYILSRVADGMVALINLESGNLWTQPIRVKNGNAITQAELDTMITSYSFVKIEGK